MNFIDSNGGPLLMLERDLLPWWGGVDHIGTRSRETKMLGSEFQTDYERASAISGWVGKIKVDGERCAIGFWGDRLGLGFVREHEGRILVIRPYYEIDNIESHIEFASNNIAMFKKDFDVEFRSSAVLIFDAAFSGLEIYGDCLDLDLTPGKYSVSTYEHKYHEAEMVFHLFNITPRI